MRSLIILGAVGLVAQLVDGSLGMGFGLTSSTLLVAAGIAPATASASIHLAEVGTTLLSGFSHHKLGNVDWPTVAVMAVPGGVGAFVGAHFLVSLPAEVAKPWVAAVLLALGVYVVWRFLVLGGRRPRSTGRLRARFLVPLGVLGGTLDAVGGGGWGPVGTTSLLASGRLTPRKVVGSVSASEFVVAAGGSAGFLLALGQAGIDYGFVAALLVGGLFAAPLAAWLVKHLAPTVLGVAAGSLILVTNTVTLTGTVGLSSGLAGLVTGGVLLVCVGLVGTAVLRLRREGRRAADEDRLGSVRVSPR